MRKRSCIDDFATTTTGTLHSTADSDNTTDDEWLLRQWLPSELWAVVLEYLACHHSAKFMCCLNASPVFRTLARHKRCYGLALPVLTLLLPDGPVPPNPPRTPPPPAIDLETQLKCRLVASTWCHAVDTNLVAVARQALVAHDRELIFGPGKAGWLVRQHLLDGREGPTSTSMLQHFTAITAKCPVGRGAAAAISPGMWRHPRAPIAPLGGFLCLQVADVTSPGRASATTALKLFGEGLRCLHLIVGDANTQLDLLYTTIREWLTLTPSIVCLRVETTCVVEPLMTGWPPCTADPMPRLACLQWLTLRSQAGQRCVAGLSIVRSNPHVQSLDVSTVGVATSADIGVANLSLSTFAADERGVILATIDGGHRWPLTQLELRCDDNRRLATLIELVTQTWRHTIEELVLWLPGASHSGGDQGIGGGDLSQLAKLRRLCVICHDQVLVELTLGRVVMSGESKPLDRQHIQSYVR